MYVLNTVEPSSSCCSAGSSAPCCGCMNFGELSLAHPTWTRSSCISKPFSLWKYFEVQGNGKFHHVSSLPLVISLHGKQILALFESYSSWGVNSPIRQWLNSFSPPFPHSTFPQYLLIFPVRVRGGAETSGSSHCPCSHVGFPGQPHHLAPHHLAPLLLHTLLGQWDVLAWIPASHSLCTTPTVWHLKQVTSGPYPPPATAPWESCTRAWRGLGQEGDRASACECPWSRKWSTLVLPLWLGGCFRMLKADICSVGLLCPSVGI